MRAFLALTGLCLSFASGCTGNGSDIGPDIPEITNATWRVLVRRDDEAGTASRGVASARLSMAGDDRVAVTTRSGRADFRFAPSGVRIVTIDGANASAGSGDLLGGYSLSVDTTGSEELPFVVYLPDLGGSVETSVSAGVVATTTTHDDSASSGAVLAILAGSIVGLADGASTEVLRTGSLRPEHVPDRLPDPPAGLRITSKAVYVGPEGFTVTPAARLSLQNELGLAAGAGCELFRLDPSTGVWTEVADGLVSGSGALLEAQGVTAAGLYCFATPVDLQAPTTLIGTVVDVEGDPLPGVLVRTGQAFARTAADGRFVLPPVASTDAAGTFRPLVVEFHGGRDLLPVRTAITLPSLEPGTGDFGEVTLPTGPVFRLRGLLVNRGDRFVRQPARISATEGLTSFATYSDEDGRFDFDDLDAGVRIAYVLTRIDAQNEECVVSAESLRFVGAGQRTLDLRWFFQEQAWISGTGGDSTVLALDSFGHGLVDEAAIIRDTGDGNGDRFEDTTDFGRVFRFNFGDLDGQATTSLETVADGLTVTSAFSARRPRGTRVELAVERARREPLGPFEPYGVVTGTLTSAGATRHVRATRITGRDDWLDEVLVEGGGADDLVVVSPTLVDPAATMGGVAFEVGVPVGGALSAYATSPTGAGDMLERIWFADRVDVAAGTREAIDLGTGSRADADFVAPLAFRGLDPALGPPELALDVAIELPNGRFVDAARQVGTANITQSGEDAVLRLPARVGPLSNARYLVAFGGRSVAPNLTVEQRALLEFEADTAVRPTPLLAVPRILEPTSAVPVSADGFEVRFSQPDGAAYSVLSLRKGETAMDGSRTIRDWTAVVPPDDTSFTFRVLPDPAVTPLEPGVYTLRIASARIDAGPLTRLEFPYERIVARWLGLSAAERQVAAVSSVAIPILVQ